MKQFLCLFSLLNFMIWQQPAQDTDRVIIYDIANAHESAEYAGCYIKSINNNKFLYLYWDEDIDSSPLKTAKDGSILERKGSVLVSAGFDGKKYWVAYFTDCNKTEFEFVGRPSKAAKAAFSIAGTGKEKEFWISNPSNQENVAKLKYLAPIEAIGEVFNLKIAKSEGGLTLASDEESKVRGFLSEDASSCFRFSNEVGLRISVSKDQVLDLIEFHQSGMFHNLQQNDQGFVVQPSVIFTRQKDSQSILSSYFELQGYCDKTTILGLD